MLLIDLLEEAAAQLDAAGVAYGHGTTNAFDEAAWLLLWRLGLPLDALDEHANDAVGTDDQAAVRALVQERIRSRRPAPAPRAPARE